MSFKRALSFTGISIVMAGSLTAMTVPYVAAAAPVTLTISTWDSGAGLKPYQEAIKEFEKLHPGIKVNLQSIQSQYYLPKVLTEMANGSAPDLMLVGDSNVSEFVNSGLLQNLSPLFAHHTDGLNSKYFYPSVLKMGNINGHQYFVPKDWSDEAVLYNKTMFQKAHVPYPKAGWTLNQFVKDAAALTIAKSGHVQQYGAELPGTWLRAGLEYWVSAYGGNILDKGGHSVSGALNSAKTEKAIESFIDVYRSHPNLSPSPQAMNSTFQNLDLFLTKRIAMTMTGPWNVNEYKQAGIKFGVAPMPIGPVGKPMTQMFWAGFAVYKNSSHVQQADELLAFFASQKWAKIDWQWAMPALKGPGVRLMEKNNPMIKEFFNAASVANPITPLGTLNWGKDVQPVLQNMIESGVENPKANVKSLIASAVSQIDTNLKQDDPQK